MNYRISTLHAEESYSSDNVETIDIDLRDPISEIVLFWRPLNATGNAEPSEHLLAGLTKVEIVDGSDVLMSLTGLQAQAIDFYHGSNLRLPWNCYLNGNYADIQVGIPFGRYLWDKELAFDASKFTNPQLKLTMDIDAGGCGVSAVKVKAMAAIFDDKKVTPRGFLMNKQIKEYTMGSATHEYTDLPTDYNYRKMFVQSRTPGTEPNQEVATLKLSEEHDRKIPFNEIDFDDLMRMNAYQHGPITEDILQVILGSQTNGYCTPTTFVGGQIQVWQEAATSSTAAFYNGDGGQYYGIMTGAVENCTVRVTGYLPHGVFEIPFGDPQDTNDWYNVASLGSLKADILSKTGGSADDLQILLQQYRPY